eukprot:389870_1
MENTGLLDHLLAFVRKTNGHLRLEALDVLDQTLFKLSIQLDELFENSRALDGKPALFVKRVKEIIIFHYLEIDTGIDALQSEKCDAFNTVMGDLLSSCESSRRARHDYVMKQRNAYKERMLAALRLEEQ